MIQTEVTLEDMLCAKESRAMHQSYLIDKYKCPLISFTVIMPGKIKQNDLSEKIFSMGKEALEKALCPYRIVFWDEKNKKTGPEAFYCVDLPLEALKKITVEIEDGHRIGRLFDIDVISKEKTPVSRADFGLGERKCLLCDRPAHACSRSHTHSTEELLKEIERVLSDE